MTLPTTTVILVGCTTSIKSYLEPNVLYFGLYNLRNYTSLYYKVVVFKAPLQGLCYTVRDAVDWFAPPTARRFLKGSNHSPLQNC